MARILKSNTSKIEDFKLHPAAKSAIDFFHSIPPQFHFPPPSLKRFISAHSVIQGVIYDDCFLAFDPVWTLRFWDANRPPTDCQLIAYKPDEISEEQIAAITWSNTLNIVLSSISKTNGLLKLQSSLNTYLPANIKQQLGFTRKTISDREVAKWANVSPSTIPEQRKQQQNITNQVQTDIFGELSKSYGRK
ncbi:MAG: hypothetical protein ACI8WB_005256 [Phenylobacterium sp.]|jgi:hypothetical protein